MTATQGRDLAELSGPAAGRALGEDSIVVLPTGAVEHHGPHLPLATDAIMAEELSARAVDAAVAAGLDVWRLPTLAVTKSDEHAWAPGTLWLSNDTLMSLLRDLARSLTTTKARTLVFFNGHGGNVAPLQVALRELRRLYGLRTFLIGIGVPPSPSELGFGIHGGWGETSLLLHLRPDLVDLSLGSPAVPAHLADFERVGFAGKPVQFGWLSDDFEAGDPSMLGVVGDPTGATAEAGAGLAAKVVADAVASLAEIARFRHSARADG